MHTITLDVATKDLKRLILQTIKEKEETVIVTDDGSVVILDESEWSHMRQPFDY